MTKRCSHCGAVNDLRNLVCRVCRSQLPPSAHTERREMRRTITSALTIIAAALVITGCHSSANSHNAVSAAASAAATNTSAAYVKAQSRQILGKCVPAQNALTELEWARDMVAGKHSKDAAAGARARHAFETCAGVSPQNDAKFQNQVTDQGTQVLQTYAHDELAGNKTAARVAVKNYVENTIPQDAVADR